MCRENIGVGVGNRPFVRLESLLKFIHNTYILPVITELVSDAQTKPISFLDGDQAKTFYEHSKQCWKCNP